MASRPVKRLDRLLTSGNLWLYILSLTEKGKVYAYELDARIEERFSFKPNKIMNYVVLYKLEDEGLISSEFRQRRKYYSITKKGREALHSARMYIRSLSERL